MVRTVKIENQTQRTMNIFSFIKLKGSTQRKSLVSWSPEGPNLGSKHLAKVGKTNARLSVLSMGLSPIT